MLKVHFFTILTKKRKKSGERKTEIELSTNGMGKVMWVTRKTTKLKLWRTL